VSLQKIRESFSKVVYVQISKEGFLLYPNPTERELRISSPSLANMEAVNVKVYDQAGKLAYTKEIKMKGGSEIILSVEHLPTGIYTVDILDSNNTLYTDRFIRK